MKVERFVAASNNPFLIITITNGVGDGFLALPVIRYLQQMCPICLWATSKLMVSSLSEMRTLCVAVPATELSSSAEQDLSIEALRDRIPLGATVGWVSLNSFPRAEYESRAIRLVQPAGVWSFFEDEARRIIDSSVRVHRAIEYFYVIGEDKPPSMDGAPTIEISDAERAKSLCRLWRQTNKHLLAFHAETFPPKLWPLDHWLELAEQLRGKAMLVLLGHSGQLIIEKSNLFAPPPGSWIDQVAMLNNVDGFVGVDSCFAHVADSLGIPGVVLFGPTSPVGWGPRGGRLSAVIGPHGLVENIAPSTVSELMARFLDEY